MKIKKQETTYLQKTVQFEVEVDKDRTVKGWIHRTIDEVLDNYEFDIDYDEKSKPVVDAMTDEEQDELDELVSTITM